MASEPLSLLEWCQAGIGQPEDQEKLQHRKDCLVRQQSVMLEKIATGTPQQDVLDQLCRDVESRVSGAVCSVMELDESENRLNIAAAPSMSDEMIDALNGLQPSALAGSCGTAAFTGEPTIVSDVESDPRWDPFREFAVKFDIGACWSIPIKCKDEVVATFAISHHDKRTPVPLHTQLLKWGANIAGIAIQRARTESIRRRAENLMQDRNRMLEQLATGDSLERVLETLAHTIERQIPGMLASILLLDRGHLWHGAAPSLPEEYNQSVHGLEIGPSVGSCGAAAFEKRRVIVRDIQIDPLWKSFRELAQRFQLRACWSQPILDQTGDVLGTLALYYHEQRVPTHQEIALIESATHLAGIAIERKQAEQALRESEEAHRVVTESVQEAILTIDEDGHVVFANLATERIFGYAVSEVLNQPISMLLPSFLVRGQNSGMRQLNQAANGLHETLEVTGQHKDGQNISIEFSFRQHERNGKQFFTGILRDVSERQRFQQELRKREAELAHVGRLSMLGDTVAKIAHEINQPLYAISNYAKASFIELQRGVSTSPQMLDRFKRIDDLATRAGGILDRIRKFLGQHAPDRKAVSVSSMVQEAVELIEFDFRHKQIEVKISLEADSTHVYVDRIQVQQVLVNLLKNAFEAMAETAVEDRFVQVNSCRQNEMVRISVQDHGNGLGEVIPASIFDSFHSTKSDGMGLGLAISRSIVEAHGGDLWVTKNDEKGLTFHFILPVANQEQKSLESKS